MKKRFEIKTAWDEDGAARGTHIVVATSLVSAIAKACGEGWTVIEAKEIRPISITEVRRRLQVGVIADFTYIGDVRVRCTPTTRRRIEHQSESHMLSKPIFRVDGDRTIRCDWAGERARIEYDCIIISNDDQGDFLKIKIVSE